jgi:ABC-type polysaccharide/polyol phosphate transport system ATPase subunit
MTKRSSDEVIVDLTNVSMRYRRTRHRSSSLKQTAIHAVKHRINYEQFYALDDISIQVKRGETLAVLGRNGAGKSTLLRVVARVLPPTKGRVIIRGKVAPMIELGAGFNPELTGVENILLYGSLLGRPIKELRARIEPIAEWAGLTAHLDVPLRAYSSGMVARLAFATATDTTPELLLIDEILSVGDEAFQVKSRERTLQLMNSGCAVIMVTHNLASITEYSDRAIYLEAGKIKAQGSSEKVIARYKADLKKK